MYKCRVRITTRGNSEAGRHRAWQTERQTQPHSQGPVHCYDESDVVGGQTHRSQHDHHGDQSGLWNPSGTDTGCGGCDAGGAEQSRGGNYEKEEISVQTNWFAEAGRVGEVFGFVIVRNLL